MKIIQHWKVSDVRNLLIPISEERLIFLKMFQPASDRKQTACKATCQKHFCIPEDIILVGVSASDITTSNCCRRYNFTKAYTSVKWKTSGFTERQSQRQNSDVLVLVQSKTPEKRTTTTTTKALIIKRHLSSKFGKKNKIERTAHLTAVCSTAGLHEGMSSLTFTLGKPSSSAELRLPLWAPQSATSMALCWTKLC